MITNPNSFGTRISGASWTVFAVLTSPMLTFEMSTSLRHLPTSPGSHPVVAPPQNEFSILIKRSNTLVEDAITYGGCAHHQNHPVPTQNPGVLTSSLQPGICFACRRRRRRRRSLRLHLRRHRSAIPVPPSVPFLCAAAPPPRAANRPVDQKWTKSGPKVNQKWTKHRGPPSPGK